jgi:signal transduction histidine kinase
MIELVNTLLDVSRIESGKLIIDPKPTDLRILLNGLLSELEPQLKIKNQVITADLPQGLPDVLLDPKLIRQVYMNYLTNAIKYSPQNTTITLKISQTSTEIISEVKDEGLGIALSEHDRIFQKFFRASNTGKQDTDGNGLGLYLV